MGRATDPELAELNSSQESATDKQPNLSAAFQAYSWIQHDKTAFKEKGRKTEGVDRCSVDKNRWRRQEEKKKEKEEEWKGENGVKEEFFLHLAI